MDQCTFEGLVNEVTGWWSQDVPDWIRFMDSDRLRYLDNVSEKRKWLRKAKVENLRKAIQERVDAIVEAWEIEDDLLINVLMATFPEDLKAYKNKLTSAQRQMALHLQTVQRILSSASAFRLEQ